MKDNIICYGQKFDISYVKDFGNLAGAVDFDSKKIIICKSEDQLGLTNTIVHEGLHALFRRLELYQIINAETEELLVSNISTFLMENFKCELRKKKIIYNP